MIQDHLSQLDICEEKRLTLGGALAIMVDVGDATIFPSVRIVKLVAAQIAIALHAAAPG